MTVFYVHPVFISHPHPLCSSAKHVLAAHRTPVVCNRQIDSAVWAPPPAENTTLTADEMPHSYKNTKKNHNLAFVTTTSRVLLRPYDKWTIIYLDDMSCEWWWRRWKPSSRCAGRAVKVCVLPSEMSLVQGWEVRHQKTKFYRLLAGVCSGQRERECVLCVLREGCIGSPRPLQHSLQTMRHC